MKKKIARRWLRRNKQRLIRDGINKEDGKQIELCFKTLGIKIKANTAKNIENQEKPQP